ncbi:cell wall hydrolase [Clostridium thailandense]|uniref:LysM peptidoglycan-binding domain-containing protein n=1 Tax=Clostridium thailandense TaxID=2794346 RepID=A0A949TXV7_9CLOT|nr:cell wall hydrolase [Clostridium thailandense]MBV7272893.1 LysM peptidoglycan-binding domain-containing protein [Clostridium thailandense]MCH5136297.1 LysM peptidoglycan-binding domain-containing protein [Clostridiaceae bacterium UIB06]
MFKSKKLKALMLTLGLSMLSAQSVHAASYTVTSGDSLYTIGNLFNTNTTTLMQNNNLSSSNIYPGQVLNVSCKTYTVQAGDSLYLIARNYGVPLSSLRQANNKWDNLIYPGQSLNIPSAASTSTVAPKVASTSTVAPKVASSTASILYTAADVDLLARLIQAEAQGAPYSAKVAVGAVVINRVQDSRFPKTISSVIYQKDGGYYQFSPVLNGWINKPASQDSISAAYEALNGADPTNGALYYFDDSTKNTWLWSKTVALRVANMVFSYYN